MAINVHPLCNSLLKPAHRNGCFYCDKENCSHKVGFWSKMSLTVPQKPVHSCELQCTALRRVLHVTLSTLCDIKKQRAATLLVKPTHLIVNYRCTIFHFNWFLCFHILLGAFFHPSKIFISVDISESSSVHCNLIFREHKAFICSKKDIYSNDIMGPVSPASLFSSPFA